MASPKKPQPKRTFGGPQPWNEKDSPRKEETVLLGHPEVAGIHTMNYDARDPHLGSRPERQDLDYVSPERRLLRSKYGGNF
jgi:hypothetical protein